MAKYLKYNIFIFTILCCSHAYANDNDFQNSYRVIDSMLTNSTKLDFKRAIFFSEQSYLNPKLNYNWFNEEIKSLVDLVYLIYDNDSLNYRKEDLQYIKKLSAIYKAICDTIPLTFSNDEIALRMPYIYNFDDPFGEKDWTKMFVSKLLETGKGNCHSLPYLYKILAEEMGIPAYLAFALNHIYIKSYSEKTGWYNTELTSGTFPIDAWIMASGYVTVEAIQNGLYMDTLSTKQSVANCLVDLAQGYQHKFGKDNPDFVVKCCNTCLKYHPTNVNAMLTKAEAQKYYIQAQMKAKNLKKPQDLFTDNSIKEMYEDMEQTYVRLHQLGYRRMPEEMYMQWMGILKNEPTKYNNLKVTNTKTKN